MSADESPAIGEATPTLASDVECCADWKHGIAKLNGPVLLAQARNPQLSQTAAYQFTPFAFCPWCGKSRRASASPVDGATPVRSLLLGLISNYAHLDLGAREQFVTDILEIVRGPSASPVETEATPAEQRIAEIEGRCNAAAPGKWWQSVVDEDESNACIKHEHWDIYRQTYEMATKRNEPGTFEGELKSNMVNVGCYLGEESDVAFIINARADVPWLLSQVRSLREALAAAQKEREAVIDVVERYSPVADEDLPAAVQLMSDIIAEREYDAKCWKERAAEFESSARSLREEREALQKEVDKWRAIGGPQRTETVRYALLRDAASLSPSPAS